MNIISLILKGFFTWLIPHFSAVQTEWKTIRKLSKPTRKNKKRFTQYKFSRNKHIRNMALPLIKIIAVFIVAFCIILIIAFIVTQTISFIKQLWYSSLIVRVSFCITAILLTIAFVMAILVRFSGLTPKPVLKESEKADTYQFLEEIVFEILCRTSNALGLVPPADKSDLRPTGKKIYMQELTPIYVFLSLKNEEVNIAKIRRVLETELQRNQTSSRMGLLGEFNMHGKLIGGILLIDVIDSNDYVKIELTLTDDNAYQIYRKRKALRVIKSSNGSVEDEEFR